MSNFVDSKKMQMYPTGYRGYVGLTSDSAQYNPEAKLSTEYNITMLSKKVAGRNFVITKNYVSGNAFEFSIGGYYFKLKDFTNTIITGLVGSSATELWAKVRLVDLNPNADPNNTSYSGKTLVNIGSTTEADRTPLDTKSGTISEFRGVEFFGFKPSTSIDPTHSQWSASTDLELCLLKKVSSAWRIPASSLLKISADEILGATVNGEEKSLAEALATVLINVTTLNATDVTASHAITSNGTLTAAGDTALGSKLSVVGKATFNNDAEIAGILKTTNTTDSSTSSNGAFVVAGGAGITKKLNVGGAAAFGNAVTVTGVFTENNTTDATDKSTASVVFKGGVGIAKKLIVGGNTNVEGNFTVGTSGTTKTSTFYSNVDIIGNASLKGGFTFKDANNNANAWINATQKEVIETTGNIKGAEINGTTKLVAGKSGAAGTVDIFNNSTKTTRTSLIATGSADRTIYLPNGGGTVALKDLAQTWTADQTISAANFIKFGTYSIKGDGTASLKSLALAGHLTFSTNNAFDIGSSTFKARNVYATTFIGNLTGTADKAKQDESGNNIKASYGAALSGGTSGFENYNDKCKVSLMAKSGTTPLSTVIIDYVNHLNCGTQGSGTKLVYFNSGTPTESTSSVASDGKTLMYLNSGVLTASSATVGDGRSGYSNKPVYLNGGVITECAYSYNQNLTTTSSVTFSAVTAGTFTASSDRRLKENVVEYKAKASILDLPVYKYDYINGAKNKIGCMAQDLQKICPEIVTEDEKGFLAIEESKLVYLLLNEVKRLDTEIKELRG